MGKRKIQPLKLENFSDDVPSPELMISTGRDITIRMDGGGHINMLVEMKTAYDVCGLDAVEVESRLMNMDGRGLQVALNEAERARLTEWLAQIKKAKASAA